MTDSNENKMASNQLHREATDWLILLTSGEATRSHLLALRSWCRQSPSHAEAFASASRLWRTLGPALAALSGEQSPAAAREIRRPSPPRLGRRAVLGTALAASGAGLYLLARPPLGLWPSLSDLAADYHTGIGEQRHIALRDGVSLDLNTASSLNRIPSPGPDRMELISGEVAVTVGTDASGPLTIAAAGGESQARIGSFNLRHHDTSVCVSCLGGRVDVSYQGRAVSLTAGQQTLYGRGDLAAPRAVDPAQVTAWRDRILVFSGERLDRVVAEVNRYRRSRIILVNQELAGRQVTARFKLDRLDDVVPQLKDVFGVHVRRLPGGMILLS